MQSYIVLILFYFSLCINTYEISATEAEELQNDERETLQLIDGHSAIFLDEEIQITSGIQSVKLKYSKFQPEFIVFGKGISISPLLSILNNYLSVSAKQAGAKARFNQAEKNISRLRNLHKNEAISTRKLQEQKSKWQSDKAIYNESANKSMIIINKSRLIWGEKLTQWATGRHAPAFDKLIKGQSTLLKITLPAGKSLPTNINSISVSPEGNRNNAFKATLISKLPQSDPLSQGLQYLFQSDNPMIQAGMNFTAWIPHQEQHQTGVVIPESALAWHLGQAFVFVKINEEHFIHRTINNPIKVNNGYFIQNQITEGEEVVTQGTQMLLSHEFRSQIPDEDDD